MIENMIIYLDVAAAIEMWFESVQEFTPNIIGALITGIIGSTAYYGALRLGFIGLDNGREQWRWFLKNFGGAPGVAGFTVIGGAVAVAFQLPQPDVFVPIQSFVLGVTWPFIVAQYVSRVRGLEVEDIVNRLLRIGA